MGGLCVDCAVVPFPDILERFFEVKSNKLSIKSYIEQIV